MNNVVRVFSLSALALAVSACGGGGGSDSSSGGGTQTPSKTPVQIISDAQSHSKAQLTTAAKTQANTLYSGESGKAEIDIALAQHVYSVLFDDNILTVPDIGEHDIENELGSDGSINSTLQCDESGTVKYTGKFNDNGTGKLSMDFSDCQSYYNSFALSGVAAVSIDVVTDSKMEYTLYFSNLNWEDDVPVSMSGLITFSDSFSMQTGVTTSVSEQYVSATVSDESYLIDASMTTSDDWESPELRIEGRVSVGSEGYVDVSLDTDELDMPYFYGSTVVYNDGEAQLKFLQGMVMYTQDLDNDGEADAGKYFESLYGFVTTPVSDTDLYNLAEISLTPYVESPYLQNSEGLSVAQDIVVLPGNYYDLDTPDEDLMVSYNWYLNGRLLEGVHGNTLPAYSVTVDQWIEVSMVVSDSINTVESYPISIFVEDTPAVVTVSNVPENVRAGDTITFSLSLTDADVPGNENLAALASAPEGATLASDGTVTWVVPDNQLFSQMVYTFGVSNSQNPNNTIEEYFDVTVSADKAQPLFRSGMEVPHRNNSQWVADFDGDGSNELLGTDNGSRVFLLTLVDGKYQQKWAYPYALSDEQNIQQVLPADMDQDGTPEILVITEKTFWLIDDLTKDARVLLETDDYFSEALLADTDNDGVNELIYSVKNADYDASETTIFVSELGSELVTTLSFSTNNFQTIAAGNVDADSSMELIMNTGLVYDLTTGANEWFFGSGFGSSFVTVGDLNGNGIDEIIGAGAWDALYVYSAVDKSQLASLSLDDTCDMHAYNLYDDATDEIVVSDCQWGNVTAYSLNGSNQLDTVWQVGLQDHGSSSLTMGDIDNDGSAEILWGSGTSSSGADRLITADYTAGGATVKENTTGVQLDQFYAAGWSEITSGDERAVFFVPSTESGYDGSVIVTLTGDGTITVGEELSTNWDHSTQAVTTDFNNDGAGDIFLPLTSLYDGAFGAVQLSDMSVQYSVDGDYDSTIGKIMAIDVNGDGYEDAVYQDGSAIKVVDIQNQLLVASYTSPQGVSDFDAVFIDDVLNLVVTSGYQKVQLLTLGSNAFITGSSYDIECPQVLFTGGENSRQFVCSGGSDREMNMLAFSDSGVELVAEYNFPFEITGMIVDPVTPSNILVVTGDDSSWYSSHSVLRSIATNGNIVWSGPKLNGRAGKGALRARRSESGDLEVMLGTSAGMYLIH